VALDAVRLPIFPHDTPGVLDGHGHPVHPLDVDSHRLDVDVRTGPLQVRGHGELIEDGAVLALVADTEMCERICNLFMVTAVATAHRHHGCVLPSSLVTAARQRRPQTSRAARREPWPTLDTQSVPTVALGPVADVAPGLEERTAVSALGWLPQLVRIGEATARVALSAPLRMMVAPRVPLGSRRRVRRESVDPHHS